MNQILLPYKNYIFSTGVVIDNDIYFFTEQENNLMKVDMKNWKIKYSNKFIDYELYFNRPDILREFNNTLYKLSLDGKYLEVLSLKNNSYRKIAIGKYDKPWGNFVDFEVKAPFLFIFLRWENQIIKINIDTYKMEKLKFYEDNDKSKKFINYSRAYRWKDTIWLFKANSNQIDIYDMNSNKMDFCVLPHKIEECVAVCKNELDLYILTINNQIYIWNPDKNYLEMFWDGGKYYGKAYYFEEILFVQEKVFLMPSLGEDIVFIDCRDKCAIKWKDYPDDFEYLDIKWSKYFNHFENKSCYYYPMRSSNYLMEINKVSGKISWRKLVTPSRKERAVYICEQQMKRYKAMYDAPDGLKLLLDLLESGNGEDKFIAYEKQNAGSRIWRYVKND